MIESSNILTPQPTAVKPAAIFARVSTTNQAETSLPSQVEMCKTKLQEAGYTAIKIISVDWCSLDLYACPDFQELRRLIARGDIECLAIYDRDRLEAEGLQRLIFLSELRDAGAQLIICQGSPIIEGPEGQIVELALAIGKQRSVLRARQGSKDGLADRAIRRRLPVTFHKLYGYQWDRTTPDRPRLVPNGEYESLKLVFKLLQDGLGYDKVINELKERAIPSPSGNLEWNKPALSNIVHNPCYAGRYFSLKKEAVPPKEHKPGTYGNSSVRRKPLTEAVYIPEIEIIDPPITWEQRGLLLDQLEKHQKLASRNAKHDYLLRGIIFCETHRGKNGEPRRFHGIPKRDTHYYACPVGGCENPYVDGPEMDFFTIQILFSLLHEANDETFYKMFGGEVDTILAENPENALHSELDRLHDENSRIINKLARLEDERLSGKYDGKESAIYDNLWQQYSKRRTNIENRINDILKQLGTLARSQQAIKNLKDLRDKVSDGLFTYFMAYAPKRMAKQLGFRYLPDVPPDTMERAFELWRDIFSLLQIEIHIYDASARGSDIMPAKIGKKTINLAFRAGIRLPATNGDIVLASPAHD